MEGALDQEGNVDVASQSIAGQDAAGVISSASLDEQEKLLQDAAGLGSESNRVRG